MKQKKQKRVGAVALIHYWVIGDPSITDDELVRKLSKRHIEASRMTVATLRSHTLRVMRELNEAGHLKQRQAKKLAAAEQLDQVT